MAADELWQLYDRRGRPLKGQGAKKDDIFKQGLLHGAAHVWMWRRNGNTVDILLQKRASQKRTWPNDYDISAAGHIDLGEDPLTAAQRETKEEIGVSAPGDRLNLIAVYHAYLRTPNGDIENEFQWLYLFESEKQDAYTLQRAEVSSLVWQTLTEFKQGTSGSAKGYVPHGPIYYQIIIEAIERELNTRS